VITLIEVELPTFTEQRCRQVRSVVERDVDFCPVVGEHWSSPLSAFGVVELGDTRVRRFGNISIRSLAVPADCRGGST